MAVQVLRLVCSCFKNAPASGTWDLSSLLVNGSPVSQETVTTVLSVIYSSMGALDYEMDRSRGQYSLSQLLHMLLFADAVGCSKAILAQLAGLLGSTVRAALEVVLTERDAGSTSSSAGGTTAAVQPGGSSTTSSLLSNRVTMQLFSMTVSTCATHQKASLMGMSSMLGTVDSNLGSFE
jgi:hypothetical protein